MKREILAQSIYQTAHLKGSFLLRSGEYAEEYFDKYLFESDPILLNTIATHMSELVPDDIEALAGLEMGGIPIATAISLKTGLPALYVRKKAKEYGTCKLAEGGDVYTRRIAIIEDVVTSGGAVVQAVKALRELGAIIDTVYCVIDRESNGKVNLQNEGLSLNALFRKSELGV